MSVADTGLLIVALFYAVVMIAAAVCVARIAMRRTWWISVRRAGR